MWQILRKTQYWNIGKNENFNREPSLSINLPGWERIEYSLVGFILCERSYESVHSSLKQIVIIQAVKGFTNKSI